MFIVLAATVFALHIPLANGQRPNATCSVDFGWATNSMEQSPCTVGSYLRAVCQPGFELESLYEGAQYNGPPSLEWSSPCWCSSVTYSLVLACQACQGKSDELVDWGSWVTACTVADTTNGTFPEQIPGVTAIPAWAYRIYSPGEGFNVSDAQNFALSNTTEFTSQLASSSAGQEVPRLSGSNIAKNTGNGTPKLSVVTIVTIVAGVISGLNVLAAAIYLYMQNRRPRHPMRPLFTVERMRNRPSAGDYQLITPFPFAPPLAVTPSAASNTNHFPPPYSEARNASLLESQAQPRDQYSSTTSDAPIVLEYHGITAASQSPDDVRNLKAFPTTSQLYHMQ